MILKSANWSWLLHVVHYLCLTELASLFSAFIIVNGAQFIFILQQSRYNYAAATALTVITVEECRRLLKYYHSRTP